MSSIHPDGAFLRESTCASDQNQKSSLYSSKNITKIDYVYLETCSKDLAVCGAAVHVRMCMCVCACAYVRVRCACVCVHVRAFLYGVHVCMCMRVRLCAIVYDVIAAQA